MKVKMDAFLFPHAHASEREIKTLLSFFDTMTILQPWHMQDDFSTSSEWGLRVVRPPGHLRPISGFPSLLCEYKNWMKQCNDRGYASALPAIQFAQTRDCTWDIRKAIRGPDDKTDRSRDSATQWHLLLHLARETEERLREAGEVLTMLKEKGSPLRDAMAEEEAQGPLNDLSDFEREREVDQEFTNMILDAWQGLFSRSLPGNAALVTLSRPLFRSLSDPSPEYRLFRFCWPDLSHLNDREFHSMKNAMEDDERMSEFKEALKATASDPTVTLSELSALAKHLDSNLRRKHGKMLRFIVRFFGSGAESSISKRRPGALSEKPLFLLEESDSG